MKNCRQPTFSVALLLLVVGTLFVFSGCATNQTKVTAGGKSVSHSTNGVRHVHIFRGLAGVLPGGKALQERLEDHEISSTIWWNANASSAARNILDRRTKGDRSAVVLMGYAVGGGGTKRVAEILGRNGVNVDALILIDPSFFEPVPPNVETCFVAHRPEVWQKWNSIMRGNPVRAESGETEVIQVNLTEADGEGALAGESHITITGNEWVQGILVREATRAFEKAP